MGEYRIVFQSFVCIKNSPTFAGMSVGRTMRLYFLMKLETVGFSAFITAALIIRLHSFWFLRDCILLGSKYLPQFKVFLKWK